MLGPESLLYGVPSPPRGVQPPLDPLQPPEKVEDPPVGGSRFGGDDRRQRRRDGVVEGKNVPARVPGRRFEQPNAYAGQHVRRKVGGV